MAAKKTISIEIKKTFNYSFKCLVADILIGKKLIDSKEEFKQYLDELGETMKQRGLTEEILQEILEDDECNSNNS